MLQGLLASCLSLEKTVYLFLERLDGAMRRLIRLSKSICPSCRRKRTPSTKAPQFAHATAAATHSNWAVHEFLESFLPTRRCFSTSNEPGSLGGAASRPLDTAEPNLDLLNRSHKERRIWATSELDKLCGQRTVDAAKNAERLLRKMEELAEGDRSQAMHVKDYHKVLDLYVSLEEVSSAHALLTSMQQTPGSVAFAIVANAWLARGQFDNARTLLDLYMERGIANTKCFNLLISEFIKKQKFRPTHAIQLLHAMDTYARDGHPEAKPDKITMTSMMQFFANRGHVRDAEALLEKMWNSSDANMQPDSFTYSLVFKSYVNTSSYDAVERAQRLLITIEKCCQVNDRVAKPTTIVYNSYLSVLANAGDGDGAEAFLEKMERRHDLRPDLVTYGIVLTAWKNSGNGDRAERLLWRIPNPDRVCFSITIAALAKQGEGKRAEAIMYYMYQSENQELLPETSTHTAVLNAWANSSDPDAFDNATRVLREMMKMERVGNVRIDAAVYHTFLKAIEHSSEPDKAALAMLVLDRMKQSRATRPTNVTYQHVVAALAATQGDASQKRKALEAAMRMYQDRKSLPPNEQMSMKLRTAMLEACGKLSPQGANGDDIIELIFRECCENGIVTPQFVKLLKAGASDASLKRVFNAEALDADVFASLPQSWRRQARKGKPRNNSADECAKT